MTAKIILNPYSARWGASMRFPEVLLALEKAGVDFQVVRSEGQGHCMALAQKAVEDGFSPILAAGGDGTIGEVVNGMMMAVLPNGVLPPLGIIPLGTANDLFCNLGISAEWDDVARVIADGKTKLMDLCSVNGRYFANNTALGLEPLVTVMQEKISWLKGVPRYLYAALQAIHEGPGWYAEIKWDRGTYKGKISLVSIGNGARTGGLFYMTPHADLFDGQLTFSFGYAESRSQMLRMLPKTMQKGQGSFVKTERFFEGNTKKLHIKLKESSPSHADGEIFDKALYEARYEVLPAQLPILMPA